MKKIYLALVMVVCFGLSALAQSDNGAIKILLQDKATKEPIPFANVVAYRDGVQVGVATTNMDGEAIIKPLAPGKYSVKGVFVGYQATEVKDVIVGEGKTAYVTIPLAGGEGTNLQEVDVVTYLVPLIDPDTKSGQTITREDYQNLATKDINSVAATTAGVYQADEGGALNVRGGRNTNTTYFVDGVKVFGTPNISQQGIESINVITGGVPANMGDLTSGAISISTRGPQSKYFGGVELISSLITDAYDYNSLSFSFGGPILKKRDSISERTVLGFFISGQGTYIKDPRPPFVDIYVLNDDKLQDLKNQPLLPSPSGSGFVRSSEFVTKDDMYTQKFRPNVAQRGVSLNGKIDYQPTNNTIISLGGFYDFSDYYNPYSGGTNMLSQVFNSANHSKTTNKTYRGQISLTQKFGNPNADKEKTQSLLSNSYFKFLMSYEAFDTKTQSPFHEDNVFNYGYIGKFDRSFLDENFAYNYEFVDDYVVNGQAVNAYTYTGRQELPVKFTASDMNPDAALFTTYLVSQSNPNVVSMNYIQGNNGVLNGGRPGTIYNDLYFNFGTYPAGYSYREENTFRIATSFNTDVKKHALSVGFEVDQRFVSSYGLSATALWTRMRLIANDHTRELDLSNPILNQEFSGLIPYYYFDYLYQEDKQTQFSEKLLEKLGLPKDYTGFVNTDALDPSTFSMDMFSAEDLLGTTGDANLVAYSGYRHDGVKSEDSKQTTSIDKFLNDKDENGRNLFTIGTFKPVYAAAYIMDKFDFKDIKFLVGLRIDRYDANQPVLKDKYALHDLARVGDLGSMENLPSGFTDNVPGNISDDAAVYVAQNPAGGKSPVAILGYREDDKWYNAEGAEISDPSLIYSSDGRPIPLYKDFANYEKNMSVGGFTTYKAEIIPQPRLGFSFPISDVANFFAHYDVLVQRPSNSVIQPLEYYYLNATSTSPIITNPNQRMQRTIDYEFGFSQVLNERKNASLSISAFYKEFRNQINQRTVVGAYPKNYIMYDNIDFSTVKGLSAVFDFRRTGGSRINFNYTLQFAEGSGSNVNSGANLASSGQPNLRVLQPLDFDQRHSFVLNYDYRFGRKKEYKGWTITRKNEKKINVFEDVGFNLSFLLGSGTPYTRWSDPVPTQGGNTRSNIVGQINGSSKPWNFRTNLRIDKNIDMSWGREESDNRKHANLNIYLQVLNLFNTKNVLNVYNYTGTPDDDGYLSSTQAQAAIAQANSAASFIDLYSIRMNNPTNYSTPRQIRIGLLFEF
ncbi:MAG: carboxypeptidase regulatory-like domain-containing protein [Bacteroidia bacterium]|nr:carboxypeptidase regulatory-like domain-containing protein [Bacteroidia bacterium]